MTEEGERGAGGRGEGPGRGVLLLQVTSGPRQHGAQEGGGEEEGEGGGRPTRPLLPLLQEERVL